MAAASSIGMKLKCSEDVGRDSCIQFVRDTSLITQFALAKQDSLAEWTEGNIVVISNMLGYQQDRNQQQDEEFEDANRLYDNQDHHQQQGKDDKVSGTIYLDVNRPESAMRFLILKQ